MHLVTASVAGFEGIKPILHRKPFLSDPVAVPLTQVTAMLLLLVICVGEGPKNAVSFRAVYQQHSSEYAA